MPDRTVVQVAQAPVTTSVASHLLEAASRSFNLRTVASGMPHLRVISSGVAAHKASRESYARSRVRFLRGPIPVTSSSRDAMTEAP